MEKTTRDEHIAWCKKRALEYVERNELTNAAASMASDLQNHPETRNHPAAMLLVLSTGSKESLRKCIEGFN